MTHRPLVDRATYRGWVWALLGGAVLMPYMMAGQVVRVGVAGRGAVGDPLLSANVEVFFAVIPVVALTGLILPVRELSVFVARSLLGVDLDRPRVDRSWSRRCRNAAWYTLHLCVGGVLSGVTLALVPFVVVIAILPWFSGARELADAAIGTWWPLWWGPVLAPVLALALVYLVWVMTRGAAWCAPRLLGPSAGERMAADRARARRLAAQGEIARELHDSVGHALSVVTLQAAAAGRVLDSDVEFARRALSTVEETARNALEDLDQVLGVLRDGGESTTRPTRTLDDLPDLIDGTGMTVDRVVDVPVADIPAVVSREAYRIVQEALTNALRHGRDRTATVRVRGDDSRLRLEIGNAIAPSATRRSGGRGVTGMRERVEILGGTLTAGPHEGRWIVVAELPLRSST